MHYAKISITYNPANKLQQAIADTLKPYDRMLITDGNLTRFKMEVAAKCNALNAKFPRCTPVKTDWWSNERNNKMEFEWDWHISFNGASILSFELKHITATYGN